MPNTITVINSALLGLNCNNDFSTLYDLPDGLYSITLQISPYDSFSQVTKYYLRTSLLENKLNELLVRLELSDYSVKREVYLQEKIVHIEMLLSSAKAEACLGNDIRALMKYRLASRITDHLYNHVTHR